MRYLYVVLFLLLSCKSSYVFKEDPCPTFERYTKSKKKHKKIVKEEEKIILNPKFK